MTIRYQALGPLLAGEGSRAFLGLAINDQNKARPVVIVWVPDGADKDAATLAKIRRETDHAAKLDHPNIVTVIGFARLDEGYARVVEFADGESLRKILELAKTLPTRIALRVICDACTGVHYAHVAGNDDGMPLIHGDLRPETLLVSFNGVTKVTGYGALAFAPKETGGKRVRGRRVHSAPEQIISGRDAITLATDVYLLGLTLYECLTGIVPWADQAEFFDHAVLTLPLPPPPPGSVAPELEQVLFKACAKKALERYPTPLALREAIEAAAGANIGTTEELGEYLDGLFPESHQLRADRRHTIDAGIADFVRRQWAEQELAPTTLPSMLAVEAPPGAPPPPPPVPKPKLPVVIAIPPEDDEEEEEDRASNTPWMIFAAIIVAAAGMFYGYQKANAPIVGVRGVPVVDPVLEHPPTAPSEDAGPAAVVAPIPVATPTPDASAPTPPAPAADVDAGTTSAAVPAPAADVDVSVELESSPPVDIIVEGKTLGRTPWKGMLPAGRHTLSLVNKELALYGGRVITLKPDVPYSDKLVFEKGTVTVTAPESAIIYIDGVKFGVAPLKADLSVYEGSHRILVTVGQAKWNESFTIFAGQHVTFNVEVQ